MKKQIAILFFLFIHLSLWSQNSVSTNGPCTESTLMNIKGQWIKDIRQNPSVIEPGQQEAFKRLDKIHEMMVKIYPQPMGVDVLWHHGFGPSYFGVKHKYDLQRGKLTFDNSNLPNLSTFYYTSTYRAFYCSSSPSLSDRPNQTAYASVNVTANSILGSVGGVATGDSWTINGQPVVLRKPVEKEMWNGYDVQHSGPGSNDRIVLIHRKGILPYIPVTRKQYLDHCIIFHTQLNDEIIRAAEQMPVRPLEDQQKEKKAKLDKLEKDFVKDPKRLKSAVDYYLSGRQTDQQLKEERVTKSKKFKEDEIKKFKDELEKATTEGMLDSPAIVLVKYLSDPVFEKDVEKGHMLVIENPGYIRKDLPKYVAQVFVLTWSCRDHSQQKDIGRILEENFPIEKLHAMIDK